MQHIVLKRLCTKLDDGANQPRTKWPTRDELSQEIKIFPEYRAALDVRLPLIDQLVDTYVTKIMRQIPISWIEHNIHECLSIDDLLTKLSQDCGGQIPDGYIDALTLIESYYKRIEVQILESLRDVTVNEDYDLEILIPFIKSPFFNRDKIKKMYYKQKA